MASVHVKFKGWHLKGGKDMWPPGSVISIDEDLAKDAIKREMAVPHSGPEFKAEPPNHPHGTRANGEPIIHKGFPGYDDPERADLGNRLANAERAVAQPQRTARIQ